MMKRVLCFLLACFLSVGVCHAAKNNIHENAKKTGFPKPMLNAIEKISTYLIGSTPYGNHDMGSKDKLSFSSMIFSHLKGGEAASFFDVTMKGNGKLQTSCVTFYYSGNSPTKNVGALQKQGFTFSSHLGDVAVVNKGGLFIYVMPVPQTGGSIVVKREYFEQ